MPSRAIGTVRYALRGIAFLFAATNVRLLAAATVAAVAAGGYFGVSGAEWCAIALAITIVWVAEALNTALERLVDLASPGIHPLAGQAKDIAAGAVLLAAIGAVSIGLIVFGARLV